MATVVDAMMSHIVVSVMAAPAATPESLSCQVRDRYAL